jgi:stalled ribosome rescue protein Dom34
MKVGVWLDKEKAIIVTLNNGEISMNTVLSNIDNYNIQGGSGTRLKGGPQDVVHDSKYLEREKHQLKKYFNDIISEIKKAHEIVLFGPAETRVNFYKELNTFYKNISIKVKDVVKTDSMTIRQVKAWVKTFFESTN